MNELKKTATFAAVALVLLASAVLATWTGSATGGRFEDEGEKFFPEFNRPEQATTLEVVSFDETTGEPDLFKVTLEKGRWVIPSHYDYPADAQDRLARTAAGIIDLTKDTIRSDQADAHKAMGVLDPRDPKAVASPDGLGKRITIRDDSNQVLADLIIGKPVPGFEGQRFVRIPGQNRVYGVQLENVELSTRFADWIETNLLKLQPADLRKIVVNDYKIDLERRSIRPGHPSILEREGASDPWTINDLPEGKEVDSQALSTLASTLGDLEIVGVRPKPAGLTAELKLADEKGRLELDQDALRSLASKGFHFVGNDLLSEEGDLTAATEDGVIYLLRFGNVTFARGEALSAGGQDEAAEAPEGSPEPRPEGAVESRYLFVDAEFNPDLIAKPEPHQPWAAGELPESVFARTAKEAADEAKQREEREKKEQEVYEKKIEAGRERAKELRDRFAAWYYVVPGDAYRKIILDRERLLRDPKADAGRTPTPIEMPGGFPGGIPGHEGFSMPGR